MSQALPYLLFILFLGLGVYLLYRMAHNKWGQHAWTLPALFLFKVSASLGILHYYETRYDHLQFSDIHKYFFDGIALKNIAINDPGVYFQLILNQPSESREYQQALATLKNWSPHTSEYLSTMQLKDSNLFGSQKTLILLNSWIAFFSADFIAIHLLFFCFIGVLGLWWLANWFEWNPDGKGKLRFLLWGLLPSALIWTSGPTKETVIIFCLGSLLWILQLRHKQIRHFIGLTMLASLLLFTSYHTFLILSIVLFFYWSIQKGLRFFLLSIFILGTTGAVIPLITEAPAEFISSKFNQQNKIGRGGFYFENRVSKALLFMDEDQFEMLHLKPKSKAEHRIYWLPQSLQLLAYQNGKISNDSILLERGDWYYLKLHYEPAKTYLPFPHLQPNYASIFGFLPRGMINQIPFSAAHYQMAVLPFTFEFFGLIALLMAWIFQRRKFPIPQLIVVCIFGILLWVLVALTSPIIGNSVRYLAPAMILATGLLLSGKTQKNS